MNAGLSTLLSFLAVIALIPVALWLLKRTPMGATQQGPMRLVGALALGPGQRLLTVEVGHGDQRRWLVLGVSAAGMQTLHTLEPQAAAPGALPVETQSNGRFADVLARQWRGQATPTMSGSSPQVS